MSPLSAALSRREFLARGAGFAAGANLAAREKGPAKDDGRKALVAITLDLEMSRNFPTWETTRWTTRRGT